MQGGKRKEWVLRNGYGEGKIEGAPERIDEARRHWARNSSLKVHLFYVGAGHAAGFGPAEF